MGLRAKRSFERALLHADTLGVLALCARPTVDTLWTGGSALRSWPVDQANAGHSAICPSAARLLAAEKISSGSRRLAHHSKSFGREASAHSAIGSFLHCYSHRSTQRDSAV